MQQVPALGRLCFAVCSWRMVSANAFPTPIPEQRSEFSVQNSWFASACSADCQSREGGRARRYRRSAFLVSALILATVPSVLYSIHPFRMAGAVTIERPGAAATRPTASSTSRWTLARSGAWSSGPVWRRVRRGARLPRTRPWTGR